MKENMKSIKLFGKIIYVNQTDQNPPSAAPSPAPAPAPLADPMPLPARVTEAIQALGGTEPSYVGQKKLTESDVKPRYNRLFIPLRQELVNYLTVEEKRILGAGDHKLEVTVMDPKGDSYQMDFKQWRSSKLHLVLIKEWMKLVNANGLQEKDTVELWCYRVNNDLRFVVNVKKFDQEGSSGSNDSTATTASSCS